MDTSRGAVIRGAGDTETVTSSVSTQPRLSVTVSVYVVERSGRTVGVGLVALVIPTAGDQL